MKKKILSAVLALTMAFGLFGGMQKDALAVGGAEYFTEDNLSAYSRVSVLTGLQYIQREIESNWIPGDIVKPGEDVDSEFDFIFMDAPLTISLPMTTWFYEDRTGYEYEWNSLEIQAEGYYVSGGYQSWGEEFTYKPYIDKVIAAPSGYDAWKVQAIIAFDGYYFCLYPVKLTPPAPEVRDCELATAGGTTTWKDYYGKTVWTITEKEDAITADLNDWAAIPDAIVKAWKESGKAISLSYKWKGYSVSIAIPAGEIARTGEAWYGGEYIAKVNEQYVTVKDWFGQPVSTEVLFK